MMRARGLVPNSTRMESLCICFEYPASSDTIVGLTSHTGSPNMIQSKTVNFLATEFQFSFARSLLDLGFGGVSYWRCARTRSVRFGLYTAWLWGTVLASHQRVAEFGPNTVRIHTGGSVVHEERLGQAPSLSQRFRGAMYRCGMDNSGVYEFAPLERPFALQSF